MKPNDNQKHIWKFAGCEFNEATFELRARGELVKLENKLAQLLRLLLLNGNQAVTQQDLLGTVWSEIENPDSRQKDSLQHSLRTAISKLRDVLPESEPPVILTLPKIGYRLTPLIETILIDASARNTLTLRPGDLVPNRVDWRLTVQLAGREGSEVWMAEHSRTHEIRVVKFATTGDQLEALKREVTTSRLFARFAPESDQFIRVLDWDFEQEPFRIESAFGGENLIRWCRSQGGLAEIPIETRLQILAKAARAVAAAHDLGILHTDVKPENILISGDKNGPIKVRVADFGMAALGNPALLNDLRITHPGFTATGDEPKRFAGGTWIYTAPEIRAGAVPTASADIYSLGVILYQLAVADFDRQLTVGWESGVADPLLREDIHLAVEGAQARRLPSASSVAERLETLAHRRQAAEKAVLQEKQAYVSEQKLVKLQARRPWLLATIFTLAIGLAAISALYLRAELARKASDRALAFLVEDVFPQADLLRGGQPEETTVAALTRIAPEIDSRFKNDPLVAARLHRAVANVFDNRLDLPQATAEYEKAAALYAEQKGELAAEALETRFEEVICQERSQNGSYMKAGRETFAHLEPKLNGLRLPDQAAFLKLRAQGMVLYSQAKLDAAMQPFAAALQLAVSHPALGFRARYTAEQSLMVCKMKTGKLDAAEAHCKHLISELQKEKGNSDPNLKILRLNLVQMALLSSRFSEAVDRANTLYPDMVQTLGKSHVFTLQVLATRAAAEGMLQHYDDAIRDQLSLAEEQLKIPGSMLGVGSLSDAAMSQCRKGDLAQGEANARKALQLGIEQRGPEDPLVAGSKSILAGCLLKEHRPNEAEELVGGLDAEMLNQQTGAKDWVGTLSLMRAEAAEQSRNLPQARLLLEKARPFFQERSADPYQFDEFKKLQKILNK